MLWPNEIPPVEQLPGEHWRPVTGFERFYSVSNMGRIYSWFSGRLISPRKNYRGAAQVSLRGTNHILAALVLVTFGQPKPSGAVVAYKNGDHSDCRLANLSWRSRSDLQREVMARRPRKPRTHCRKGHPLTPENTIRKADRVVCLTCHPIPEVTVQGTGKRAEVRN